MSAVTDQLHTLVVALEAEEHQLAAKARRIYDLAKADLAALGTEVKADAAQVEADAEPVITEAEADVHQVAADVEQDAEQLPHA